MKENNLYLLLDVIARNGSAKRLIREGVDFSEIAEETSNSIINGLLEYTEERITLTEKGISLLKDLERKFKKTNKEEWIERDFDSQITKIDKNTIFLPRQSELTF